jgi:signal transduction histidine kinase
MGLQQQFPFGIGLVMVGFFLGFRSGLVMLLMTGLSVYLWGTHSSSAYPLALPINVMLAIPVLAVSAYIRALLNEQRVQREMLGDFIAILAHEVRTPLSTIKMAAENLQEHEQDEFSSKRGKNLILAAERIEDVVSRCMDTDLFELKELRPKYQKLDLKPFLQERIDLSVDPDRVTLDCKFSESIMTDPFLFGAVISNLLENALKYSLKDSQVGLNVFEKIKRGRKGVNVSCENFIDPIVAPDPKKLFRKYYRSEKVSFHPGMGLGLWFSKEVIHALSGFIGSKIRVNKVIFWVWVPCKS